MYGLQFPTLLFRFFSLYTTEFWSLLLKEGLCNIPLSHSFTLRADIFTLFHYCNRQAHVLSLSLFLVFFLCVSRTDILILLCSQTYSFMLCPVLQAHMCERQRGKRGVLRLAARKKVFERFCVCKFVCEAQCVCVCVESLSPLGLCMGLLQQHSSTQLLLSSTFQEEGAGVGKREKVEERGGNGGNEK